MEDVNDLLQALLGLVLTGHVPKGDAGLFLHIHLGVGLAHAADAAHAPLAADAPHEEDHGAHHDNDGQDGGEEQVENLGGIVHRRGVVAYTMLIEQVFQSQISNRGRGGDIHRFPVVLERHPGKHVVPLLLVLVLGNVGLSLLLHPLLEGDGKQAALQLHRLHQVSRHPLAEGGVGHLLLIGAVVGAGAAAEDQREKQRPQNQRNQAKGILFVVSFIWFQRSVPPIFCMIQNRSEGIIPQSGNKNKKIPCKLPVNFL